MPYPFDILKNEKLPARAQDVETFIRHALGQHLFIVEKLNLDETNKRFQLHFWQRHIGLDRYVNDGEIGKIYWGGAEIIEWSDSTEIVRMWTATPNDWYLGEFSLDRDKVIEEWFEQLEELSNEIKEHFMNSASENQTESLIHPATTFVFSRRQEMPMPNSPENNGSDMKRNVFVVHGRNEALRSSMFDFLRSIGLNPIEWTQAVSMTEKGSPYIGEILDSAMKQAQAIVVLFTGDDEAKLKNEFLNEHDPDYERILTPQARPNVLFEAGMAFGKFPDRTILVQVGPLRQFSDIAGRHMIHLANDTKARQDLAQRLLKAECAVNLSGTDWHTVGNFSVKITPGAVATTTAEGVHRIDATAFVFPPEETLVAIAAETRIELNLIKVLIAMANAPGFDPGSANIETLGQMMSINAVRAEHFCEMLVDLDYVYKGGYSTQHGRIYVISPQGREFLVMFNLI